MTRSISEVKNSSDLYLQEAELCANHSPVLGFAAMTMALSCVVAFGEALLGKARAPAEDCIKEFYKKMNSNDWLLDPQGHSSPYEILTGVRNALFHVLSLPNHVCFVRVREDFRATEVNKSRIGIVPSLFVRSVRETIANIISANPGLCFDLLSDIKKRSPVSVTTIGSKAG